MDTLFIIGLVAFLVCLVASRLISEGSFKRLTSDQKLALMDAFSNMRMYSLVPILAVFLVFLLAVFLEPSFNSLFLVPFLVFILIFVTALQILVFLKLKILELPPRYKTQFILSKIVSVSGFALWIGTMIYPLLGRLSY